MTNKEVAELAGVSSAAVSRFLNGGYLSDEKRERIAAAIEQTGYVPSANARILRMKKSDTVGIVLTKSDESTLSGVTAGLEKMAAASGGKTTAADLRKQIEENDRLDGYKEQLAAEKALDFVLAAAK